MEHQGSLLCLPNHLLNLSLGKCWVLQVDFTTQFAWSVQCLLTKKHVPRRAQATEFRSVEDRWVVQRCTNVPKNFCAGPSMMGRIAECHQSWWLIQKNKPNLSHPISHSQLEPSKVHGCHSWIEYYQTCPTFATHTSHSCASLIPWCTLTPPPLNQGKSGWP